MTEDEKKRRYRYLQLKQKQMTLGNNYNAPAVSGAPAENPNDAGPGRSFVNSPALPILGGLLGGAMTGGAGLIMGAGATALGAAGGEGYRQLLARGTGAPAPETSWDAAKEIGMEGATQGAMAMLPIGQALGATARGAGNLASKIPFVGPGMKAMASGAKKTAGDLFQLLTKVDPKNAGTLYENPGAIFPGAYSDAQAAWRSAATKAGIPIDDVSPELIKVLKGDAEKTVFDVFERIQAGAQVSAAEAQTANEALRLKVMPAAVNERNKKLMALLGKMGDAFRARIGQESPELAAANKKYAIASAGKKFRTFFPQNKSDTPAWVRTVALPGMTLGAGFQRGEPVEGAMQGAGIATLGSPLFLGGLIAGAGGARQLLPYVGRAAKASLAEMLKKELEGQ